MRITIESTTKIVELEDPARRGVVPARVWEGRTESGIAVVVLVTRVAVLLALDRSQFEAELVEHRPPGRHVDAWPLRLVL